jgi:DNA-binding LacI/PurR family transcriptional regulator
MVPGQLYFVITENDLVQVLKGCRLNGLSLGTDIGIIAYNDTPMKEIAGNGITVISTDFAAMGRKAALFVTGKEPVREHLPTYMILRDSV